MRNNDPFSDLIRSIEENLQRSSAPPPGDDGNDQGGGNGGGNDGQPGRQSGDVNLRQFFCFPFASRLRIYPWKMPKKLPKLTA